MRIGQLGCDVELEVVVVRDHTVPQLDHKTASLFEGLYAQGGMYVLGKCMVKNL